MKHKIKINFNFKYQNKAKSSDAHNVQSTLAFLHLRVKHYMHSMDLSISFCYTSLYY